MGEHIRSFDWSGTALGPIETWPQSLRTTLSLMLNSRFPMFLYWGPELNCFYNDAFRPSLGKEGKHPGSLGKPGREYLSEAWQEMGPVIARVKAGGEATWNEDQMIPLYRNGQMENVYWTYSYSPVFDETGAPGGVLVTCIETTQKVLTLARLEESTDELSFAIEATELATFDVNPLTNKLKGNKRLKEWFGLGANEEVDLQTAVNVIAEKDKPWVAAAIQRAYEYSSGGGYNIEYTILNPLTNQERYVRAKGRVWFNEHKEACRFNGTLQDITREVQVRKRMEESESRFRSMIEQVPVAIGLTWGKDHVFQDINPSMLRIMHKEHKDDAIGRKLIEVMPELKDQVMMKILQDVLETGRPYIGSEIPAQVNVQGKLELGYYNLSYTPLLEEGMVTGIIHAAVDVTEHVLARKKVEESEQQVQRFAQELAAANEDLRTSSDQVLKTNEMLSRTNKQLSHINGDMDNFIYTASHDLRTPISNIEGLMYAILEDLSVESKEDPVIKYLFGSMASSIERFKRTVDDLTEITKLQREEASNEDTRVDLFHVIKEVQLDLSSQIKQVEAQLDVNLRACEPVSLSPKNVRSIIYNLMSNALKYHAPSRPLFIQIRCHQQGNYQVLSVQDNGLGMNLTDESKVFGMFKRLHNHVEGSGIGLYIVKKILENAGGRIEVESKVGVGSIFRVYFLQSGSASGRGRTTPAGNQQVT